MFKEQLLQNAIDYIVEHLQIIYHNDNKKIVEILCKHLCCKEDDIRQYILDLIMDEEN